MKKTIINYLFLEASSETDQIFPHFTLFIQMYLKLSPLLFFDVLLTVHLSIFISVLNQLDAQNLF